MTKAAGVCEAYPPNDGETEAVAALQRILRDLYRYDPASRPTIRGTAEVMRHLSLLGYIKIALDRWHCAVLHGPVAKKAEPSEADLATLAAIRAVLEETP